MIIIIPIIIIMIVSPCHTNFSLGCVRVPFPRRNRPERAGTISNQPIHVEDAFCRNGRLLRRFRGLVSSLPSSVDAVPRPEKGLYPLTNQFRNTSACIGLIYTMKSSIEIIDVIVELSVIAR